MPKRIIAALSLLTLISIYSFAPASLSADRGYPEDPPFLGSGVEWVDSVMASLNLEQRISQMIMVAAYSRQGDVNVKQLERLVSKEGIGGLIFFQGNPVKQANLSNRLQSLADVPLLIAMDAENGLGMRLDSCVTYPPQMILGALGGDAAIYRMGRDMARQMKRLGVHMNLAPVADVNNNPLNPVIHTRSFGSDPSGVSKKVVALVRGMQDQHILVAAKHFPGHGDTDTDSHHALPRIDHAPVHLDSVELRPFREAIKAGITGIMSGHLEVPAMEADPGRASSMSASIIRGVLRDKLEFRGLVVTDALNMRSLSALPADGSRALEAVKAGNDILLMPSNVPAAVTAIKRALKRGEIREATINASCRRILEAKYWAGAHHRTRIRTEGLVADLNAPAYMSLYRELVEGSMTLVRNRGGVVPLDRLESTDLATLTISQPGHIIAGVPAPDEKEKSSAPEGMAGRHWEGRDWQAPISDLYLPGRHFRIAKDAPAAEWAQIKDSLRNYNTVIVSVLGTSDLASRRYGISDATSRFIGSFDFDGRLILNVAGLPYCLNRFPDLNRPDAILLSYSDESLFQEMAMQGIFGGIAISGQTPVPFELHLPPDSSARSGPAMLEVPAGTGLYTAAGRLSYGLPEDVGLNADTLRKLEAIVDEAINMKAIPGCQVLVARYGKVVWHRAYGYHTYLNRRPVALDDIYDLASVTKVSATLPSLMRLRDLGLFHEDSLLATYGVVPDSSNKAGLLCEDILTHRSGLVAWIPFYYHTLEPLDSSQVLFSKAYSESNPLKISQGAWANKNVVYKEGIYQDHFSQEYPLHVADHLYMNTGYRDSIWDGIANSELVETKYRYSDLGLMLMQRVVEAVSDTLLYPYVWRNFYAPLGATTTGYVPLERFERSRIVPTENDMFFRHQLLQGHVHDPGAAMLGGVAGHAGLFSSANDLAKLWQMFLNGGSYGGRRYIEQATMDRYNTCLHCDEENRRGIGFDKPIYWEENAGTACDEASPSSFGHSGFTGTLVWVDPETELLYVFLSNRVHPNQSNILLIENDIRTRIQSLLYRAIEK